MKARAPWYIRALPYLGILVFGGARWFGSRSAMDTLFTAALWWLGSSIYVHSWITLQAVLSRSKQCSCDRTKLQYTTNLKELREWHPDHVLNVAPRCPCGCDHLPGTPCPCGC